MKTTRKDFLKVVAVSAGALIALAYSTAPDEEPIENWLAESLIEQSPQGDGRWAGWTQLGLPVYFLDKPTGSFLRTVKRHLRDHLKKTPPFKKFAGFRFILHTPGTDDPLMQRWSGGMICYAK